MAKIMAASSQEVICNVIKVTKEASSTGVEPSWRSAR
jgi:hypothetical protein